MHSRCCADISSSLCFFVVLWPRPIKQRGEQPWMIPTVNNFLMIGALHDMLLQTGLPALQDML